MISDMQVPLQIVATDRCLTYADNGILGAKNLLSYPYVETTKQIFTDMGDGRIKINGTASERLVFYLHDHVNQWKLPSGTYIASIGTDNNNIAYAIGAYNGTTWVKNLVASTNKNARFTVDYNGYDRITIFIEAAAGNYSNEIVKPMIRLATDPDNTYQPYAMTNRQLTERKDFYSGLTLCPAIAKGTTVEVEIPKYANNIVVTVQGWLQPTDVSWVIRSMVENKYIIRVRNTSNVDFAAEGIGITWIQTNRD